MLLCGPPAQASSILIADDRGGVLIHRTYKPHVPATAVAELLQLLTTPDYDGVVDVDAPPRPPAAMDATSALPPIVYLPQSRCTAVYIRHNQMVLAAFAGSNANAAVLVAFLFSLIDVLAAYVPAHSPAPLMAGVAGAAKKKRQSGGPGDTSEVTPALVRSQFVLVYSLLDEMMDGGVAQVTTPSSLTAFVSLRSSKTLRSTGSATNAATAAAAVTSVTSAVPWRPVGIVHVRNEVFLDVVETLHASVAADGTVSDVHIDGAVRIKPFLSGIPDLKLGLAENVTFATLATSSTATNGVSDGGVAGARCGQVLLEDVKFHQCVRLGRFAAEGIITFVPPDCEFDLLTYRLPALPPAVVPLAVSALVDDTSSATHVSYDVRVTAAPAGGACPPGMHMADVTLRLPAPADADTPRFKASAGKAKYVPAEDVVVWRVSKLRPGAVATLRGRVGLPSVAARSSGHTSGGGVAGGSGDGNRLWRSRSRSSERQVVVVAPGAGGAAVAGEGVDRGVGVGARRPVRVGFDLAGLAPSGLKVRFLTVSGATGYRAWVRYLTTAGRFHVKYR